VYSVQRFVPMQMYTTVSKIKTPPLYCYCISVMRGQKERKACISCNLCACIINNNLLLTLINPCFTSIKSINIVVLFQYLHCFVQAYLLLVLVEWELPFCITHFEVFLKYLLYIAVHLAVLTYSLYIHTGLIKLCYFA